MRIAICLVAMAVVGILTLRAQERSEDFIKAAVIAAGGEEILAKFPAGQVTGKGTLSFAGTETPFVFEQVYEIPGRYRTLIRCTVKGLKVDMLQVVKDGVAKQFINGKANPLTDAALKDLQMAAILNEIGQLTPLLTDKKYSLKLDKQAKATETIGFLVQVRNHPEIRVAIERKSGHLVRIAYKGIDLETGKEAELETSFDDFKAVSGLTRPMHSVVTRDGKRLVDLQIEKFTPLERIDPKAFALEE